MDRGQSRLDIEDLRLKEAPFRTRKALGWMIKDRGWTEKPQDGQNGQLKYQAGRQRTESEFQVCTCFTHTVVLKVCLCMLSLSIPPPSLSHSLCFSFSHIFLSLRISFPPFIYSLHCSLFLSISLSVSLSLINFIAMTVSSSQSLYFVTGFLRSGSLTEHLQP